MDVSTLRIRTYVKAAVGRGCVAPWQCACPGCTRPWPQLPTELGRGARVHVPN
jgi:hypothetical protein